MISSRPREHEALSYTVKPLEVEVGNSIDECFGAKNCLLQFGSGKCLLPPYYDEIAQNILDAEVRKDDTWVFSYPKTGSTWCQEMVWLIGNDLDFDTAKNTLQQIRAPLIELSSSMAIYYDSIFGDLIGNSVEYVDNQKSPRFIKSHLPVDLLPFQLDEVKPKRIYMARNPKDVCVSYYYHCKLIYNMNTSWENFCKLFLRGDVPMGNIWDNYLPFWEKRHEENFLFLKYEDAKRDLRGTLQQIADFMGKSLTEEQCESLCDFLSVKKMKDNRGCNLGPIVDSKLGKDYYKRSGNHFIRKGESGDWKNHMTPELSRQFDEWIEENTIGTGLQFN